MIPYFDQINPQLIDGDALDQLLAWGWYRMHQSLFTCSHVEMGELSRVHWLRYHVAEVKNLSSHKRIRNRNKNFRYVIQEFTTIADEHAELHARYRASIDFDGALSIEECLLGVEMPPKENIFDTRCISIFDGQRLIAGGYFDLGNNSAASILHFFDPDYARYSLGKYLILITIDYMIANEKTWYYPGYVVEGISKMNYKLFLGKEQAQYFLPENDTWRYFQESILAKQSG